MGAFAPGLRARRHIRRIRAGGPAVREKVKRLAGEPLARFRRPDSRCEAVSGGIPSDTGHNRRVVFSPCTPPTACGNAARAWVP